MTDKKLGLKSRTFTGIVWSFAEQLLRRGVSVLVTLMLALFLVPEDFGLLAMMTVFIAIATALMDSGIKQAIIRKKDPTQSDFSTAFFLNIILGAAAYLLLFATAPLIAHFYQEERLVLLIRVMGVVVLISAFQVIQSAILSRELNFKAQLQAAVPASVVSGGLAVLSAYVGAGVWALILQIITNALLMTLMLWKIQGWRPTLEFDSSSAKEIYLFGYKLFISGFLDIVFRNLYIVVIAKVYSAQTAGLFFFAERIKQVVVNQVVKAIMNVTYPALSTYQDNATLLRSKYRKVLSATVYAIFPIVLLIAAMAEPIFQVIFPSRWWPAIPYLQLMCITSLLLPLHSLNLNILKVLGRSDLFLGIEVIKKISMMAVLFFTYQHGVIAILIGQILQSCLSYLVNVYFASRLINYSIKEQLQDVMPCFLLAAGIATFAYLLVQYIEWPPIALLAMIGPASIIIYIVISMLAKIQGWLYVSDLIIGRLASYRTR